MIAHRNVILLGLSATQLRCMFILPTKLVDFQMLQVAKSSKILVFLVLFWTTVIVVESKL
jgi:hypothetical protein